MDDKALIPSGLFTSISIPAIFLFCFFTRFGLLVFTYFVPLFYQAVRGDSATSSGVSLLPLMLSVVVAAIGCGQVVGRLGSYWWFLLIGPFWLAVGSGLFYTISVNSSSASLIGFQILCGLGIGSVLQNGLLAIQAEFKDNYKLVGQATAFTSMGQVCLHCHGPHRVDR